MLGERLATLRKERGLTQKQLAAALHLSVGTIAMYETDKRKLDMDKINIFCDFFNISSDYLLGRSHSSTSTSNTSNTSSISNTSNASRKTSKKFSADQLELLQLYNSLSPINRGRALERVRILAETEIHQKNDKVSDV